MPVRQIIQIIKIKVFFLAGIAAALKIIREIAVLLFPSSSEQYCPLLVETSDLKTVYDSGCPTSNARLSIFNLVHSTYSTHK